MASLLDLAIPGLNALGSNEAGREQRKYLNSAMGQLKQGYEQAQATQQPIYQGALGNYQNMLGQFQAGKFDPRNFNFQEDPGYKYALGQGLEQIGSQAAAGGMGHSPLTTKALMGEATGMAQQGYQNAFNRNLMGSQAQFAAGQGLTQPYLMPSAQNISGLQQGLGQELAGIEGMKGNISGRIAQSPYQAAGQTITAGDNFTQQLMKMLMSVG